MNFKLDENQQMIMEAARDFARTRLADVAEMCEKERHVPQEIYQQIADVGFAGLPFAEEYGGSDLGLSCYVLMLEQFSEVDSGLTASLVVSTMFMHAVKKNGTEEQKMKYIPPCVSGELRGSFAFTEAGTGSDPKQLTSTYRKTENGYVINGVKRFITNAAYPGPIIVFANDAETGETTGFVFDKFCKGYSLSTAWDTMSTKASAIYDIFMDDIEVPADAVLGKIGGGFGILKSTIALSKMGVMAQCVGNMGCAIELATRYAKEKLHRGKPIAQKYPTIQTKLAEMTAIHDACQLLVYRLAEHADDPNTDPAALIAESGMVKGFVSEQGVECCRMGMAIMGAYSVCDEYKIERCMRHALQYPVVEGVSDLQRIMCASYIISKP